MAVPEPPMAYQREWGFSYSTDIPHQSRRRAGGLVAPRLGPSARPGSHLTHYLDSARQTRTLDSDAPTTLLGVDSHTPGIDPSSLWRIDTRGECPFSHPMRQRPTA